MATALQLLKLYATSEIRNSKTRKHDLHSRIFISKNNTQNFTYTNLKKHLTHSTLKKDNTKNETATDHSCSHERRFCDELDDFSVASWLQRPRSSRFGCSCGMFLRRERVKKEVLTCSRILQLPLTPWPAVIHKSAGSQRRSR